MTTYYVTSYNGSALSAYGAVTPGVSGVHDGPSLIIEKLWLPGAARPHVRISRREREPLRFRTVVAGATHTTLVENLAAVKGILFPDDDEFHPLIVADRSGLRILAKPLQFPVEVEILPNIVHAVELQTTMEVYPYWEDATEVSEHLTAVSQVVTNYGNMKCYPTFTCELNNDMPDGLYFTVGAITFTYAGALEGGDSLVVKSDQDCPDVELNGTRDWANVDDSVAVLPFLARGNNTISLSDNSKFHLTVAYRQRYW